MRYVKFVFLSFIHKDYFLTLTKIQREVIRGSPIWYMLEFVGSGIDVDSGYKVSDCVICIFTKFIFVTGGVKIGCSDYIGGSAYVITNQQMEVIRLPWYAWPNPTKPIIDTRQFKKNTDLYMFQVINSTITVVTAIHCQCTLDGLSSMNLTTNAQM